MRTIVLALLVAITPAAAQAPDPKDCPDAQIRACQRNANACLLPPIEHNQKLCMAQLTACLNVCRIDSLMKDFEKLEPFIYPKPPK